MSLIDKFEKIESYRINYGDLDAIFEEIAPGWLKMGGFTAACECGNYSSHQFGVTGEVDDPEEFGQILKDPSQAWCGTPGDMLDHLCSKGLLPKGNYIVEVCW